MLRSINTRQLTVVRTYWDRSMDCAETNVRKSIKEGIKLDGGIAERKPGRNHLRSVVPAFAVI